MRRMTFCVPAMACRRGIARILTSLLVEDTATFLVGLISSSKDFTGRALRFANFQLRSLSSVSVVSKFLYLFPFPSDIFNTLDPQFHNDDV